MKGLGDSMVQSSERAPFSFNISLWTDDASVESVRQRSTESRAFFPDSPISSNVHGKKYIRISTRQG